MSRSTGKNRNKKSDDPPEQKLGDTPVAPWDMPTPEEKEEAEPVRRALKDAVRKVDSQDKADEVIESLEEKAADRTATEVERTQPPVETPSEAAQQVQTASQSAREKEKTEKVLEETARWIYDPLYRSWWRYVDDADPQTAGNVHREVDRLTGRQLHFENVIVLFAKHDIVSPTNLNIHLEQDWVGNALLFRDGKKYDIRWSTVASEEEIHTGRRRPIQFFHSDDKTPFPLKPGHTWILVVTPETAVTEKLDGEWLLQFHQPPGAK